MQLANSSLDLNGILIQKRVGLRNSGDIESFFQDHFGFDVMMLVTADLEQRLFRPLLISRDKELKSSFSNSYSTESNWFGKLLSSSLTINESRVAISGFESVAPLSGDYWGSVLGARLMDGEKVIGAVILMNESENAYSDEDILLLDEMIPFAEALLQSELRTQQLENNHVYLETIEKLLHCLDGSEEPDVFLELIHSALSVHSNVGQTILLEYKTLTQSYIPIASIRDTGSSRDGFYYSLVNLVNGRNISGNYVHSACAHTSSPRSLFGDELRKIVIESAHREIFLVPISDSKGIRIGVLIFAFQDCSSETFRRDEPFNAMVSIAGTYLRGRLTPLLNADGTGSVMINHNSVGLENLPNPENFVTKGGGTFRLTDRDMDVLQLLAVGATNVNIAERLGLAEGTVKNRLVAIFKKLDVNNRMQAVNKWKQLNLDDELLARDTQR